MNTKNFLTIGIAALAISASLNLQAQEIHQNEETKVNANKLEMDKLGDNSRMGSLLRVGLGILSITSGKPSPIELSDISNIFTSSKVDVPKDEVKKEESSEKPIEIKDNTVVVLAKFRQPSTSINSATIKLN